MKLLVRIDVGNVTLAEFEAMRADWVRKDKAGVEFVSVDEAYLPTDDTDDSFRVFEFVGAEEGPVSKPTRKKVETETFSSVDEFSLRLGGFILGDDEVPDA